MSVKSVADAKAFLYDQPLDSFVSDRNELVKELRAAGDKELAAEVKAMRKPSAVAAEVNRVVRADPAGIALILQAADLLRDAQQGALEGSAIDASELQQQYRAAIAALAQKAQSRKVEVRAAIEAATIDVASNDDLRAGSLVAVPEPSALFGIMPAGDAPAATKPAKQPKPAAKKPKSKPRDELAERRAKRDAKKTDATKESEARAAREQAEKDRVAREKEEARLAKQREKERQQRRKALTKQHRDAVRAHLATLDDEHAAALAVEDADRTIAAAADQITALEEALEAAQSDHALAIEDRGTSQESLAAAQQASAAAQDVVDELVAALEEFNNDHAP